MFSAAVVLACTALVVVNASVVVVVVVVIAGICHNLTKCNKNYKGHDRLKV